MTLDDMCRMAARCTDRYDELIKTLMPDGTCRYTGEAENCFNILRDGINEAYAEISRTRLVPDRFVCLTVPDGIRHSWAVYGVQRIGNILFHAFTIASGGVGSVDAVSLETVHRLQDRNTALVFALVWS